MPRHLKGPDHKSRVFTVVQSFGQQFDQLDHRLGKRASLSAPTSAQPKPTTSAMTNFRPFLGS